MDYVFTIIIAALVLAIAVVVLGFEAYNFFKQPTPEQIENIREWLIYAVTTAEIHLGGGTGALKLRQVYDQFVSKFPAIAQRLSFRAFSDLVDEALVVMREMIEKNDRVKSLVEGKGEA